MYEHQNGLLKGFTKKYKVTKLIYCESFYQVTEAIRAEKIIKGWARQKKINLIKSHNPWMKDLLQQ